MIIKTKKKKKTGVVGGGDSMHENHMHILYLGNHNICPIIHIHIYCIHTNTCTMYIYIIYIYREYVKKQLILIK